MLLTPGFTHSYPKFPEFISIYWVPESTPVSKINQLLECTPILEIPSIYWIFRKFQYFSFLGISIIFSFFGNFYHFWKFHHFSILGHSHQIISFLGHSHHFSGIYLLLSGLTSHIWNFPLFFRIFLDPFGIS